MWQRGTVTPAIAAHKWSPKVGELMEQLRQKALGEALKLLARSYSVVKADHAAGVLGLTAADATAAAVSCGWVHMADTNALTPPTPAGNARLLIIRSLIPVPFRFRGGGGIFSRSRVAGKQRLRTTREPRSPPLAHSHARPALLCWVYLTAQDQRDTSMACSWKPWPTLLCTWRNEAHRGLARSASWYLSLLSAPRAGRWLRLCCALVFLCVCVFFPFSFTHPHRFEQFAHIWARPDAAAPRT